MSEEEKFDEILRGKFAEKEFVFNEENWEKAEAMMDAAKRRKAAFRWAAIFLLGLFAGIALMLPFIGNKNEKSGDEMAEIRQMENFNTILQERAANKNQDEKKEIAVSNAEKDFSESNSMQERKDENSGIQVSKDFPEQINENGINHSKKASEGIAFSNIENNVSEKGTLSPKTNKTSLPQNRKSKSKQDGNAESMESKEQGIEANEPSLTTASNKPGRSKKETQGKIVSENKSTQHETLPVQIPSTEQTKEKDSLSVKILQPAEIQSKINAAMDSGQQTSVNIQVKDSAVSKIDSAGNAPSHADSAAVIPQNSPAEQAPKRGLASATIFSIDAGTNFTLGWNYRDTLEGRGFNPLLGVGFTHYFNPTWSIYSGIQYGSFAHLKASQKIFSSQTFGFGSNIVDTIVDSKTLYYAVLPIQFQYHFNSKNSIGFGGSISYLVNARSKIIINTLSSDSANTFGTPKTETGYYSGAFNRWDISLAATFRRKISEKLGVSGMINYGLFDLKSNAFFSKQKFERNIGFKIIVSYDLFQY